MEYINEGYRSIAYLRENKFIILKGKNKRSFDTYQNEISNLNFLSDKIHAVLIPRKLKLLKKDNKNYPFGGLEYDYIEGKLFSKKNMNEYDLKSISLSIANFLDELHSIPLINIDKEKIISDEKKFVEENVNTLLKYSPSMENILNIWKEQYFEYLKEDSNFCYIHGDLWYENFIISNDGKKLNGIIDFENFNAFFKEYDFVPLLHTSEQFMKDTLNNYKNKDEINLRLINLLFIRRVLCFLSDVVENEPDYISNLIVRIEDAINKYL